MTRQIRTDDLSTEEQAKAEAEREAGRQQALDTIKSNPVAAEKLMKARYDAAGRVRGSLTLQPITATPLTTRTPKGRGSITAQPGITTRGDAAKPTDPEAAEAAMRKRYEGN
jgi:hypothetical protein